MASRRTQDRNHVAQGLVQLSSQVTTEETVLTSNARRASYQYLLLSCGIHRKERCSSETWRFRTVSLRIQIGRILSGILNSDSGERCGQAVVNEAIAPVTGTGGGYNVLLEDIGRSIPSAVHLVPRLVQEVVTVHAVANRIEDSGNVVPHPDRTLARPLAQVVVE